MYSGGGIEPDKFMAGPVEGFAPTKFGARSGAAVSSSASPISTWPKATRGSRRRKNKKRIAKGFTVTDEMLKDFREQLTTQKVTIDEEAFKTDLAFIKAMIHYEIDLALFGVAEARRNLILQDPQAQFAIASSAKRSA